MVRLIDTMNAAKCSLLLRSNSESSAINREEEDQGHEVVGNLAFSSATTHVSQTDLEIQRSYSLLGEMVLNEDIEKRDADLGIQVSDATVHQISTGSTLMSRCFFLSFFHSIHPCYSRLGFARRNPQSVFDQKERHVNT